MGLQYRSSIFSHDDQQKDLAEKSKQSLDDSGQYDTQCVSEIVTAHTFYKAEEYHQ